jgi:hypothetical protein
LLPLGEMQALAVFIRFAIADQAGDANAPRPRASNWGCRVRVFALVLVAAGLAFAKVRRHFLHGDNRHTPKARRVTP